MTREEIIIMRDKILEGLKIAYNRLLEAKQKEDGELVFSEDGITIKRVKARDLEKLK